MLWEVTAAAAAKSLQSCPALYNSINGSPPGSPVPGILQARTMEWVAISFSNAWKWKMKMKLLSPVQLLVTPWTAAYQAPLSMGFSRQEYWSGVPLPSLLGSHSFLKITACRFSRISSSSLSSQEWKSPILSDTNYPTSYVIFYADTAWDRCIALFYIYSSNIFIFADLINIIKNSCSHFYIMYCRLQMKFK